MISTDEDVAETLDVDIEKAREIKEWIKELSKEVMEEELEPPF
mgnify:CR=1 FL=1